MFLERYAVYRKPAALLEIGDKMDKKRTVQRSGKKKRGRPRIRFNFAILLTIFFLSFLTCFILYMTAANLNDDFFGDSIITENTDTTENQKATDSADSETEQEASTESTTVETAQVNNPVPQSEATDISYLDSCCMITDSTLLQMGVSGGFDAKNVFGNAQINAANCMSTKVESNFGTVAVYDIIKNKKPETLYIMLGSDLGTSSADDMIASYTTLVNNLHGSLPDMKIYIMQLPPVIYDSDTKTNEMVNDYNNRLLAMANTLGVYCIDTNTALKNETGSLKEEYWSYDTLSLSEAAYKTISGYILTHVV